MVLTMYQSPQFDVYLHRHCRQNLSHKLRFIPQSGAATTPLILRDGIHTRQAILENILYYGSQHGGATHISCIIVLIISKSMNIKGTIAPRHDRSHVREWKQRSIYSSGRYTGGDRSVSGAVRLPLRKERQITHEKRMLISVTVFEWWLTQA